MSNESKHKKQMIVGGTLATAFGAMIGVVVFTFAYADGASYLSDNPDACINCHVMQPHYDSWSRSSHASVATCNDCHAPPEGFVAKYQSKALNGFNHSWAFTTGSFPDEIMITKSNRRITEAACRSCHESITATVDSAHAGAEAISCIRCHSNVAHGP